MRAVQPPHCSPALLNFSNNLRCEQTRNTNPFQHYHRLPRAIQHLSGLPCPISSARWILSFTNRSLSTINRHFSELVLSLRVSATLTLPEFSLSIAPRTALPRMLVSKGGVKLNISLIGLHWAHHVTAPLVLSKGQLLSCSPPLKAHQCSTSAEAEGGENGWWGGGASQSRARVSCPLSKTEVNSRGRYHKEATASSNKAPYSQCTSAPSSKNGKATRQENLSCSYI